MTANSRKIFFGILIFAFVVRVAGVGYGLPLWLISDEPPFVLGALKMIELKTPIPRFHTAEFSSVLYYPPYISYLLLPAFSAILAFKYFNFDGNRLSFANYIGSDLSSFFIAARFINIMLALASIYLAYKIAKNIFKDEWAGLATAFFISTSLLHILLSIAARQWMPVSFIFLLVLYFLTHPSWSFKRRYFLSILISGIGIGASVISCVALFLVGFYFLLFEEKKLIDLFREKFVYLLALVFVALAFLPLILYPSSLGFQGKISFFENKSITGFLTSPAKFILPLLFAEPILILMSVLGLFFAFIKSRRLFWFFLLFIAAYLMVFYVFFRSEDRFLTPMLPAIAILAGFGFAQLFSYGRFFVILLILPLAFSLQLSYLAYKNDSRANLRSWIEKNIVENSKIVVSARLMRLSSDKEAIVEQASIDENSLRQVDRSELFFDGSSAYPSFHALNISDLDRTQFYENFEKYVKDNSYQYLILSRKDFRKDPELHGRFMNISSRGEEVISFGEDSKFSVADSKLGGNPFELFETKELGPSVSLYNLK